MPGLFNVEFRERFRHAMMFMLSASLREGTLIAADDKGLT
jgi:hypothetical protein